MKRIGLLALAVVLIVLSTCVSIGNSAVAEEEITFRGIPWGINIDDAEEMLKKEIDPELWCRRDYNSSIPGENYCISNLHDLVPWFPEPRIKTKKSNGTNLVTSTSELQVAGYNIAQDGIILHFAYLPDENGEISPWRSDTVLYAASYTIKVPGNEYDKTVADLKNKLSGVYGQKCIVDKRKVRGNCTFYIWQGANDTYVILGDLDGIGVFSYREVVIIYASKVWEKKMLDALARAEAEKEAQYTPAPFGNGNSDGL